MYSGAYCRFRIQRGTDGGAYRITGSMNVSRDIATTVFAVLFPVNRRKHEVVKRHGSWCTHVKAYCRWRWSVFLPAYSGIHSVCCFNVDWTTADSADVCLLDCCFHAERGQAKISKILAALMHIYVPMQCHHLTRINR